VAGVSFVAASGSHLSLFILFVRGRIHRVRQAKRNNDVRRSELFYTLILSTIIKRDQARWNTWWSERVLKGTGVSWLRCTDAQYLAIDQNSQINVEADILTISYYVTRIVGFHLGHW